MTLCNSMFFVHQVPLSSAIPQSLLKFMSTELVMLFNHFILCAPFSFAFNLSHHQGLLEWVGSLHHRATYCSFRISSSNEYSGLISLRMSLFDLLAVQRTLKNLLQHHSSKASLVLSLLYGTALISIRACLKNHSLD